MSGTMKHTEQDDTVPAAGDALDRAIDRACDGVGIRTVYQPIVDLVASSIVGHEGLLRVDGLGGGDIGALFARADELDARPELEAAALRLAIEERPHGADGFLALNVTASCLLDGALESTLRNVATLDDVVFEIDGGRIDELSEIRDRYAPRGARFSLADDSVSYDDLRRLMAVRPAYVKLDRRHFERAAHDEAALALVETMAMVAGRVGAELVAHRIEQPAELQALRDIGVTLGQGFLLGEPGAVPSARDLVRLAERAERLVDDRTDAALAVLVEAAVTLAEHELATLQSAIAEHVLGFAVLVSDDHEPLALLRRRGRELHTVPISVVPISASVRHAGRIALARPAATRFEPIVVVDELDRFVGVLRLERILGWLANDPEPTRPAVVGVPAHLRRKGRRRRHRTA